MQNCSSQAGTKCRNCVFLDMESPQYCKIGKLDKLIQHGGKLLYKEDRIGKWIEIDGRICRFHRTTTWSNKYSSQNWCDIVHKEAVVKIGVIVNIDDQIMNNPELLEQSVKSLNDSTIKPQYIIFPIYSSQLGFMKCVSFIRDNVITNIPYRIEVLTQQLNKNQVLNLCIPKFKDNPVQYTLFMNGGYQLPKTFLQSINYFLNYECGRFILSKPIDEKWNGLVVQNIATSMYKVGKENVVQSIIEECENSNLRELIREYGDFNNE